MSELNEGPTAVLQGFQIKENDEIGTPVAVVPVPFGGRKHKKGFARSENNARLVKAAPELLAALKLHLKFLESLPRGWLGKTSADIGALNEAYLTGAQALRIVEGKE